ncbi:unnamed protein product [Pleuronectes platessa]|uniref:Uncharacterized protein n=1 Tax=Pleuronectes platessa TaxID=8262 RepID=A0A9N7VZK7_PLEPL|nr:unnamed protein product [Pleuronectes platessa]
MEKRKRERKGATAREDLKADLLQVLGVLHDDLPNKVRVRGAQLASSFEHHRLTADVQSLELTSSGVRQNNHDSDSQSVFSYPRGGGYDMWLLCPVHRAADWVSPRSDAYKGVFRAKKCHCHI